MVVYHLPSFSFCSMFQFSNNKSLQTVEKIMDFKLKVKIFDNTLTSMRYRIHYSIRYK